MVHCDFNVDRERAFLNRDHVPWFGIFHEHLQSGLVFVFEFNRVKLDGSGVGELEMFLDVFGQESISTLHEIFVKAGIL